MTATATCVTARPFPQELDQVFREHSEFVYRTAYRVTGNAEDAEDVLQTLFVRLLRRELPPDFDQNPKAIFKPMQSALFSRWLCRCRCAQ